MLPRTTAKYLRSATLISAAWLSMASVKPAQADDALPPPPAPRLSAQVPSTLARMPVSYLRLGILKITLEKTSLDRVREVVRTGSIGEQGDASEHIYWLCYTLQTKVGFQRVWIISSGEFGGPRHTVDTIVAASIENVSVETASCPKLDAKFQPVSLDRRTWLGLSRNALVHQLGQPSLEDGEQLEFSYTGKVATKQLRTVTRKRHAATFYVSSNVTVETVNGATRRVWASKTTQN